MPPPLALLPSEQVMSFYVVPGVTMLVLVFVIGWAVFSGGRGE